MASRGTFALKRDIVTVCRRLYERGLIAGPDGNVSVRVAPDRVLVTPAGMAKVDVQAEDLIDGYWLFVNPVILGAGTRLFPGLASAHPLTLVECRALSSGVVCLHYERKRGQAPRRPVADLPD